VIDLHVHTARCGHASGTIADYVEAARLAGISTIAFTDHLPLPDGYPTEYAMDWPQLPQYVRDVCDARDAARASGGPEVLLGIEADWIPGFELLVSGALRSHEFDVVLGSVHMIGGWAFDDPDRREGYDAWTPDALWERFFDDLASAASTGLYDVMAHPDLVKKFRFGPDSDPQAWYEEAASVFAENGVAIEVNTAGLRKPCAELYPSMPFLKACRKRGVPATLGSDAHCPAEVGAGFTAATEALREAGYDSLVVFRARRAEEVPLWG
jgi:histidinol-phosphatase (PHP family)